MLLTDQVGYRYYQHPSPSDLRGVYLDACLNYTVDADGQVYCGLPPLLSGLSALFFSEQGLLFAGYRRIPAERVEVLNATN